MATPPLSFLPPVMDVHRIRTIVGPTHDVLKKDPWAFSEVLAPVKRRRADDVEYQVVGIKCILVKSSCV